MSFGHVTVIIIFLRESFLNSLGYFSFLNSCLSLLVIHCGNGAAELTAMISTERAILILATFIMLINVHFFWLNKHQVGPIGIIIVVMIKHVALFANIIPLLHQAKEVILLCVLGANTSKVQQFEKGWFLLL